MFAATARVPAQQPDKPDAADQSEPVLREQLARDFRGRPLPADMTTFGPFNDEFIKGEPEGLRITLPRGRATIHSGGLALPVHVSGDFEITTAFEILEADEPAKPNRYGVGVLLSLNEKARVGRLVRSKGRQVATWDRWVTVDGKERFLVGAAPAQGNVGRLRLKRTKDLLHFLWAPGLEGDTFQQVHQAEFEYPEVTLIRWELSSAVDDGQSGALDVRLLDLKIRSSTAPEHLAGEADQPPAGSSTMWLLGAAIIGLLLLSALAISLLLRRRRSAPAAADSATAPLQADSAGPPIAFACSHCGRRLKARVNLAGKQTRCPHCGQLAVVPESASGG
jgi:hypothetical protein